LLKSDLVPSNGFSERFVVERDLLSRLQHQLITSSDAKVLSRLLFVVVVTGLLLMAQ
jgi:hypothetical protein